MEGSWMRIGMKRIAIHPIHQSSLLAKSNSQKQNSKSTSIRTSFVHLALRLFEICKLQTGAGRSRARSFAVCLLCQPRSHSFASAPTALSGTLFYLSIFLFSPLCGEGTRWMDRVTR
ncbi:hypothetical protein P167DRAFT_135287 [Morchella conica CCBAS932]|uniref:Uncharacterized protein n=1 Tax=Morchella conica CCBAS932 TaxID=1392247 RepID=A0A3N4L5B1_9PEZI|nr:hypothetical protein P167DRAFT_135287 [Morchella conica CCBAS932]